MFTSTCTYAGRVIGGGGASKGATGSAAEDRAESSGVANESLEQLAGHWQCQACTTAHADLSLTECSVCGESRN